MSKEKENSHSVTIGEFPVRVPGKKQIVMLLERNGRDIGIISGPKRERFILFPNTYDIKNHMDTESIKPRTKLSSKATSLMDEVFEDLEEIKGTRYFHELVLGIYEEIN